MEYLGHEYVEIAGIKWATCNIGANSVTDTGLYFQWGDTQGYTAAQVGSGEGQKYFSENDCIYYNNGSYTKYNEGDSLITLESTDDAVQANWGGSWRMPTTAEFQTLGNAVNRAWTTNYQGSGVAGVVLTSNADGATLFFPACGIANYGSVDNVGGYGNYWSSSLSADYGDSAAYYLRFSHGSVNWGGSEYRCLGFPVRGVFTGEPKEPEDLTREELSYSSNAVTIYKEDQYTLPVLTNVYNLELTYNSSNTNVATINSSGVVSIVGNGTTTISAIFAGNNDYNAKTISYILIVDIKKYLDYKGLETFKQQLDIEFNKKANSSTVQGIITELSKKVDKISGKGLSTNDYTDAEKNKVVANEIAITTLQNTIKDDEEVISSALNDLNTKITTHTADTTIHVTQALLDKITALEDAVSLLEGKVVAKYNVTNTSSPIQIVYKTSGFSAIEIDGVAQPSVISAYTFSTTGEHTVKYTLTDSTSISESAFTYCTSLTSIDIPDSVTSIDGRAFENCSGLKSVTIGSGVTSIMYGAFYNCSSLTSIDIPSGVTTIGSDTFNNCYRLTSITIPDGVTNISSNAFKKCTSLTSIDIPDSVTSIDGCAFENCSNLTSITIGSGVTSIMFGAFYCGTNLSEITSLRTTAITLPTSGQPVFKVASSGTLKVPTGSTGYDAWLTLLGSGWSIQYI